MIPDLRDDLIGKLETENDTLRCRVAELEAMLTNGRLPAPLEWGLTPSESMVFGALTQRELATKEFIMTLLYRGLQQDEAAIKIVDVFICKLRKKLKPFGITIKTCWGTGYSLAPEIRTQFKNRREAAAA